MGPVSCSSPSTKVLQDLVFFISTLVAVMGSPMQVDPPTYRLHHTLFQLTHTCEPNGSKCNVLNAINISYREIEIDNR